MSFTSDVKNELFQRTENELNFLSECYGSLIFSRLFTLNDSAVTTENKMYAEYLAEIIAYCGAFSQIDFKLRRKGSVYNVSIPSAYERKSLLSKFSHTGSEISLRVNPKFISTEAAKRAFLKGAFISCGAVSDPYKEYHLEFSTSHYLLATDLVSIISSTNDFEPMIIERNGRNIIYLKDSEKISDFLTYIGAFKSSMELMQAKMLKEVRNNVNRKNNFETANIDKTVKASFEQNRAIEKIIKVQGFEAFPPQLLEIAKLRLENPEMSLRELSEILKISRSGVNHRLKKIMEMAEDIED